jgi:hypothetical protein
MLIAAFVIEYSWEGVPDSKGKWDDEMKAVDFMVVRPRMEKCVVRLHPRDTLSRRQKELHERRVSSREMEVDRPGRKVVEIRGFRKQNEVYS